MLPLVQAESGGLSRLWWLFLVGAVLLAAFGCGSGGSWGAAVIRCWTRG